MSNTVKLTTVMTDVHANGHKQIFRHFARALSPALFYDYHQILDHIEGFKSNETAAIGGGVMIFHGWIEDWPHETLSFIKFKNSFQALNTPDRQPIDMALLLLSPKQAGPLHLSRLSTITRFMRDLDNSAMLRGASTTGAIEAIFNMINDKRKAA